LIDAKRVLREVKLLQFLKHENIIPLYDMIPPVSVKDFNDVYMVMEFMETDLHKIISSKNELSEEHIQYFMYQLLSGLKFIHSAHVIHRDLKPSNLLLNSDCRLKICDFGLARGVKLADEKHDYELTEYVVTRWYRAPEIMVAAQEYDFKSDIWSAGCIFAELFLRKPLFAGDDYIHQMNLIFDFLGTPTGDDLKFVTNPNALQFIKNMTVRPAKPYKKKFPTASADAIDLMQKMLSFNPHTRISADEALAHPYLSSLAEELDNHKQESSAPFDFDFEKTEFTRQKLREFFYEEVRNFRTEIPALDSTSTTTSTTSSS